VIRPDVHDSKYLEYVYEKCQHCHLFVDKNDGQPGTAEFVHLSRGDAADERIEASHDAEPSGLKANLATWMVYGPPEMRERFITEPREAA
jgi:hypothetical protein